LLCTKFSLIQKGAFVKPLGNFLYLASDSELIDLEVSFGPLAVYQSEAGYQDLEDGTFSSYLSDHRFRTFHLKGRVLPADNNSTK
jgi:hypothetical protein